MDEQVAEPEGVLARERGPVRPDQLLADEIQETITDARTGVTIAAPRLFTPTANKQFPNRDQPLTLTIVNGVTTGSTSLTYTFEVATDEGFASRFGSWNVPEQPNQTSLQRARQARATSRYSTGTERAPSLAFIAMGKKEANTTVARL